MILVPSSSLFLLFCISFFVLFLHVQAWTIRNSNCLYRNHLRQHLTKPKLIVPDIIISSAKIRQITYYRMVAYQYLSSNQIFNIRRRNQQVMMMMTNQQINSNTNENNQFVETITPTKTTNVVVDQIQKQQSVNDATTSTSSNESHHFQYSLAGPFFVLMKDYNNDYDAESSLVSSYKYDWHLIPIDVLQKFLPLISNVGQQQQSSMKSDFRDDNNDVEDNGSALSKTQLHHDDITDNGYISSKIMQYVKDNGIDMIM